MSHNNNYDDEALARALQIEYEREYRRRSMQQHLNVSGSGAGTPIRAPAPFAPSAPLENSYYDDEPFNGGRAVGIGSHRGKASTGAADESFGSVEISDEAFARQLERETIEEERRRKERKQHLQQQRDSYRVSSSSNRGTNDKGSSSNNALGVVHQGRIISTTQMSSSQNSNINHPVQSSRATPSSRSNSHAEYSARSHSRSNSLSSSNISSNDRQRESYVTPTTNHRSNESRGGHMNRNTGYPNSHHMSNMAPVVTGTAMIYSDEELAFRLEQEMRDEELARQEFIEEQIRQSSIAARSMSDNINSNRRQQRNSGGRRGCRRCLSCICTLVLIGVAAALFFYFFVGSDDARNFIPDPDQFRNEDPFNSANIEDANLWKTKGGVGLGLVVVNALDTIWQPYFFKAVDQWNSGTPDTLTLTTEIAEPDSACTAINGKLKVCNGNYGETSWRGINKILLENNWIYSSAARMNEFYTSSNDGAQRQYTMCHEVSISCPVKTNIHDNLCSILPH
jgi:hypothetical protein